MRSNGVRCHVKKFRHTSDMPEFLYEQSADKIFAVRKLECIAGGEVRDKIVA